MRPLAWLVLLACSPAVVGADGTDDARPVITVHAPQRWKEQEGPLLHLDYVPPSGVEGIGGTLQHETTVIDVTRRLRIVGDGSWWKASLSPQPLGSEIDELAQGWRASYELSYDLGPFRIGASVAAGHVDSRYERGTYRIVGVSAYRTVRLSRWMLAWISLGVGRQQWFGQPPPGESNATFVGLTLGTTFR